MKAEANNPDLMKHYEQTKRYIHFAAYATAEALAFCTRGVLALVIGTRQCNRKPLIGLGQHRKCVHVQLMLISSSWTTYIIYK